MVRYLLVSATDADVIDKKYFRNNGSFLIVEFLITAHQLCSAFTQNKKECWNIHTLGRSIIFLF